MEIEGIVSNYEEIIIYGAGAVANITYLYLKHIHQEHKVICFAVSNKKGNSEKRNGISIELADDVIKENSQALVIVATQRTTQESIHCKLMQLGCEFVFCVNPEELISEFYNELYKEKIQKNKIFVMNYNGCGFGCNPKYIVKQILKEDWGNAVDIIWGVDENVHKFPDGIRTVQIGSYEYYRELATSHIWIDNVRKQIDVRKRNGQYYIQTWHGAAPMKKVEKDLESKVQKSLINASINDSIMVDLFISGSEFYSELIKQSFWYDGEILKSGLPRHDIFWNRLKVREKVIKELKLNEVYNYFLYAPTFRDDFSTEAYDIDLSRIKKALQSRFGGTWIALVSKHPNNRGIEYNFNDGDYIDVSTYDDFEEILATVDILITDYSGCVYDFSYTKKPIFLYQNDYEKLMEQRDFYVPFEKMPYIRSVSMNELVEKIASFDTEKYERDLELFMSQFGNYDDGTASSQVCDRIKKILKE